MTHAQRFEALYAKACRREHIAQSFRKRDRKLRSTFRRPSSEVTTIRRALQVAMHSIGGYWTGSACFYTATGSYLPNDHTQGGLC